MLPCMGYDNFSNGQLLVQIAATTDHRDEFLQVTEESMLTRCRTLADVQLRTVSCVRIAWGKCCL